MSIIRKARQHRKRFHQGSVLVISIYRIGLIDTEQRKEVLQVQREDNCREEN